MSVFELAGFTLEGIGGGFTAWTVRDGPLEFRLANHGTASAPDSLEASAFVEVSHDPLSWSSAPAFAVQQIRRRLDRGDGDNEESGALSWHFKTAADAVAWVTETLDARTFSILSTAALSVDGLAEETRDALTDCFNDRARMFGGWHGVLDVLGNLHTIHTHDDEEVTGDLMLAWLDFGTAVSMPDLDSVEAMLEAVSDVADSTPTEGHGLRG